MNRLTAAEMARANAQVVTYFHMEPETLNDVITTARLNAEQLEREAEDLKQLAADKIKEAQEAKIMLRAAELAAEQQQQQPH